MNEDFSRIIASSSVQNQEQATELMSKLFTVAQPSSVYASPVTAGDYVVITASEVSVGMGFGWGSGGGGPDAENALAQAATGGSGMGTAGGGGGGSMARPVAVISVGPNGVEVEPIVDATKIALAAFTAAGTMAVMLSRMLGKRRR